MFGSSGETYSGVQIGNQVWMAENLDLEYKVRMNGSDSVYGNICFNNQRMNCNKYGRLYQWWAAMDTAGVYSNDAKGCGSTCSARYPVRGVCPKDWHLPTKDEWNTLIEFVGDTTNAGNLLKQPSAWSGNANGSDVYSFSILPGGYRYWGFWNAYDFYAEGASAMFWTSSMSEYESSAYFVSFTQNSGHVTIDYDNKIIWLSIRCVHD